MNIQFDLNHPVDVNFFKNSINELNKSGYNIFITYRSRGKLTKIIGYELGEYESLNIRKHYNKFISKIIGQLYRDYKMIFFQKRNNINLSVCFGPTTAIASWINKIPYLAFDDDFEYNIPFYHANIFATRHIMPSDIKVDKKNIYHYNGFKELSYLHPSCFSPSIRELSKYSLNQNGYVFIREIANVSLNYTDSNSNIVDIVKHIKKNNLKIILSLEDDLFEEKLEKDCIILQEPVDDIYSLIKYSLIMISSGDTMAREACLLGTPCIYIGGREMLMNNELIEMGAMFKEDNIDDILKRIDFLCNNDIRQNIEEKIKYKIETEWENTTEVILKHINDFIC